MEDWGFGGGGIWGLKNWGLGDLEIGRLVDLGSEGLLDFVFGD